MQTLDQIRYARKLRADAAKWAIYERQEALWELKQSKKTPAYCYSISYKILAFFKGVILGYLIIIGLPIGIFIYLFGAHWFIQHGITVPAQYVPYLMNIAYAFFFYAIADMFGRFGRLIWWIIVILCMIPTIFL